MRIHMNGVLPRRTLLALTRPTLRSLYDPPTQATKAASLPRAAPALRPEPEVKEAAGPRKAGTGRLRLDWWHLSKVIACSRRIFVLAGTRLLNIPWNLGLEPSWGEYGGCSRPLDERSQPFTDERLLEEVDTIVEGARTHDWAFVFSASGLADLVRGILKYKHKTLIGLRAMPSNQTRNFSPREKVELCRLFMRRRWQKFNVHLYLTQNVWTRPECKVDPKPVLKCPFDWDHHQWFRKVTSWGREHQHLKPEMTPAILALRLLWDAGKVSHVLFDGPSDLASRLLLPEAAVSCLGLRSDVGYCAWCELPMRFVPHVLARGGVPCCLVCDRYLWPLSAVPGARERDDRVLRHVQDLAMASDLLLIFGSQCEKNGASTLLPAAFSNNVCVVEVNPRAAKASRVYTHGFVEGHPDHMLAAVDVALLMKPEMVVGRASVDEAGQPSGTVDAAGRQGRRPSHGRIPGPLGSRRGLRANLPSGSTIIRTNSMVKHLRLLWTIQNFLISAQNASMSDFHTPRESRSPLTSSQEKYGQSSYYYAHTRDYCVPTDAQVGQGPGIVTGGAPEKVECSSTEPKTAACTKPIERFSWIDEAGLIKLYLFRKDLPHSVVWDSVQTGAGYDLVTTERSVDLKLLSEGGKQEFRLRLGCLYAPILPEESTCAVSDTRICVTLRKADSSHSWGKLKS